MQVSPRIRGPLVSVGNFLGATSAFVIILAMIVFVIGEAVLRILHWYL
jgi:hypothetical protein